MALHPCKGQCNRGSSEVLGKRSMSMDDNEHDNNDIQKEKENWISGMFTRWKTNDMFVIEEPRLLAGDMVSVLLTCQLLGLVDVLNTPEFWLSGGFAQPVGLMPEGVSTLGTLVKRDSLMSIAWLLSSIKNRAYTISTVIDDLTAIKCAFTIFIDYCSFLIIFAFGASFMAKSPIDGVEILRQSYFTILMLCTFRVLYGRCNR